MIENQNISNDITVEEKDDGGNVIYELSSYDFDALAANATELQLKVNETIQADTCVNCAERAEHWFKLTVLQTGDYSFSANTYGLISCKLYDVTGTNELVSDNIGEEDTDFLINYTLFQGQVYYLRIIPNRSGFSRFNTVITGTFTPVESVSVFANTVSLIQNETITLSATVLPENATYKEVVWKSSDENIATIDANGQVVAKSYGTVTISAEATDGSGKRGQCTVIVEKYEPGLKTVKLCRVRKEMSMDDSAILRDSTGAEIMLQVDDTVSLLSTSKITANGRVWYRILYNGMMMHVTADDESFEEIDVVSPGEPNGTSVQVNTGDGSNLRLRCVPNNDDDSTIIGRFADGTTIMITNEAPQNDIWYAVYGQTTDGISSYGWCSGAYLGNDVEYGTLEDVDELTVRSGAGYNYTAIGKIYKGDCVRILAKECATANGYPWHKIRYNDSEGYVVAGNNPKNFTFETKWVALVEQNNNDNNIFGHISELGVAFIKDYEEFHATPYDDGYGNLTIGYGYLIKAGESYQSITEEEADQLLRDELAIWEERVDDYLLSQNASWSQNQYDALVSLAFNAGNNFKYVVNDILNGDDPYTAFAQISYSNGKWSLGLYRRRMDEADIFVNGEYQREYRDAP